MTIVWYCTYITLACIFIFLWDAWYGLWEMGLISFLMVLDTIFGIASSYALWDVGKKKYYEDWKVINDWFSSTILKVGLMWKIATLLVPLALIVLVQIAWWEINWLIKILITGIAGAEVISIIQNMIMIKTKKKIKEVDALTMVMQWVLWVVKKFILQSLTTEKYKDGK